MLDKLTFGKFFTKSPCTFVKSLHAAPTGQSMQFVQSNLEGALSFRYSVFLQSCGIFHAGFLQPVCFSLGISPFSHDLQDNCFLSSWYLFAGHLVQIRASVRALVPNVPKSQLVHDAAPVFSVVSPWSHCWHCVKSLSSADRKKPLGHLLHPCPKVPAPHG